jgi:hypothetical protein
MYQIKKITEVRAAFWNAYPEFKKDFRKTYRQNDYKTDIRTSFCDYVDSLQKSGVISEKLAHRVTL